MPHKNPSPFHATEMTPSCGFVVITTVAADTSVPQSEDILAHLLQGLLGLLQKNVNRP
jgi:hypothetical protein